MANVFPHFYDLHKKIVKAMLLNNSVYTSLLNKPDLVMRYCYFMKKLISE